MLEELKVLNGIITPKYDIYNDIYTVTVDNDVYALVIDYKATDTVYIKGNEDLKEGENIVYLEIGKRIITLIVNKKEEELASFIDPNLKEKVEVEMKMPNYIAPLIGGSCFLIILLTFVLLFKKRK